MKTTVARSICSSLNKWLRPGREVPGELSYRLSQLGHAVAVLSIRNNINFS